MITLTDRNGRKILLAADEIRHINQASASQAWHGVRSNVRTADGQWIEIQETIDEIGRRIEDEGRARA